MRTRSWIWAPALAALFAVAGCKHGESATGPNMYGPEGQTSACPLAIPGTTVNAEETQDGMAMTFTTDQGDVAELRRQVYQLSAKYNSSQPGAATSGTMGHVEREAANAMDMGGPKVASQSRVEEIDGGARLIFTPNNPNELKDLRSQIRRQVQRMVAARGCVDIG